MKVKNKGKVYPSPSSPESDVLKVLPAAILTLASLLSLEDREVLSYLITRSLKTTTATTTKSTKKAASKPHKPPISDCDCFDCYTSYWFRWDSSPNRELINQAIDAFEDHLSNGEKPKKAKRRDKTNNHRNNNHLTVQLDCPSDESEEVVGEPLAVEPVVIETTSSHKGLARKVLPDVLGLFNSRLWSLWTPNV